MAEISKQTDQLDELYLSNAVRTYSSNLSVIGGVVRVEDLSQLNISSFNKLIEVANQMYDYIVVDTATHSLDEMTMFFVQKAHHLVLVSTFDLLAIKDNRFYIQTLKQIGTEESKIKVVINRQDWYIGSLEPEVIQKQINHPIYYALPNDWELCVEAANYGKPILEFAPNSPLSMSYKILAGKLTGLDILGQTSFRGDEEVEDTTQKELKTEKKKGILNWF